MVEISPSRFRSQCSARTMAKTTSRRLARNAAAATLAGALACLGSSASGQSSTNGTIIVTGTVTIVSGISPSTISGIVSVFLDAGQAGDVHSLELSAPVTLTWNGSSGSGTATLPYNWTYDGTLGSMRVNFEVSATLASSPFARTSANLSIPSSGGQTMVTLPASI
jgi:hypothetical protein